MDESTSQMKTQTKIKQSERAALRQGLLRFTWTINFQNLFIYSLWRVLLLKNSKSIEIHMDYKLPKFIYLFSMARFAAKKFKVY